MNASEITARSAKLQALARWAEEHSRNSEGKALMEIAAPAGLDLVSTFDLIAEGVQFLAEVNRWRGWKDPFQPSFSNGRTSAYRHRE